MSSNPATRYVPCAHCIDEWQTHTCHVTEVSSVKSSTFSSLTTVPSVYADMYSLQLLAPFPNKAEKRNIKRKRERKRIHTHYRGICSQYKFEPTANCTTASSWIIIPDKMVFSTFSLYTAYPLRWAIKKPTNWIIYEPIFRRNIAQ